MYAETSPNVVLCVDDDEKFLTLMRTYLQAYGYAVMTATTASEAVQMAVANQRIQAVVLDYAMPGLSGAEISALIKKSRPEIPIILFSGSSGALRNELLGNFDVCLDKEDGMAAFVTVLSKLGSLPRMRHRRRFPRYPISSPVILEVERFGETSRLSGTAMTISEGGLAGKLNGELATGEVVSVMLSDPDFPLLRVRAQVRYRHGDVYGFAFVALNASQQLSIQRSCERLASS